MPQIKFCPFCDSAAIIVWQGQLGAELKCLVCGNKVWIKPCVDDEGGEESVKKSIYYQGEAGAKYGIWDTANKGWRFGISEDTPMLAMARLYQHIGCAAKRSCFEARRLPKGGLPK